MEQQTKITPELWVHPAAFDEGIDQIILANTLDENKKCGMRTRIVRFAPGARTRVPFVHDYHEEVYLLEGDQVLLGMDGQIAPDAVTRAGTFFKRPAGTYHGPFASDGGCLLLEIHYY